MEQFKDLKDLTNIDEQHLLLGEITGFVIDLDKLHTELSRIELITKVPDEIRGQFNVSRNMALYTYFLYSLAPEVHMKTYSVMELALRTRFNDRKSNFKTLIRRAVKEKLISDNGFRIAKNNSRENHYCNSLIDALPDLRNELAHGSTILVPDCIGHIENCADFINQIFDT